MFSVIISEKGGAERRESFDRTEINVGRVQGNDLMLPKGNVSKRHARLLYRDGRFIVTDLKSTNGTYVNGRKIAQATIVREGDKIYIGDFVLRIESAAGAAAQTGGQLASDETPPPDLAGPPSPAPGVNTSAQIPNAPFVGDPTRGPGYQAPPTPDVIPPVPGAPTAAPPAAPRPGSAPSLPSYDARLMPPPRVPGAMTPSAAPGSGGPSAQDTGQPGSGPSNPSDVPSSQPASSVDRGMRTPGPPRMDGNQIVSHFPLENDPDESQLYAVPAAPRVPSAARPLTQHPIHPPPHPRPVPIAPGPRPVPIGGGTTPSVGAPAPPPIYPPPAPQVPVERSTSPSVGMAGALGATTPQPPPAPPAGAITANSPAYDPGAPAKPALVPAQPQGPAAPPPQPFEAAPPRPGSAPMAPLGGATGITPPPPALGTGRLAMPPPARFEPEPVESTRVAAQRAALAALVDRVGEAIDLRLLDAGAAPDDITASRIERAITERVAAMREAGEIRPEVDGDALAVAARRELLELGPLTPLLDDDDVSEIYVTRHDHVVAMHGKRHAPAEIAFSSERAVGRALRRIARAAGRPIDADEVFVERRLARGQRLFAVLPSAPEQGHMLTLRKPQRADLTLEDLVRSGTISRAMAGLLAQCIEARANILVTGAASAGAVSLLGALAAAGSLADRVVILQEGDEIAFSPRHTVTIPLGDTPAEGARAVQAAARLRPDRLVVTDFSGGIAAAVIDAMGDGVDGVLAASRTPTLRQATARLTADLGAQRPGLGVDVAHEWLAASFDLAIEIAQLRDGRHRVLRIAEIGVDGARLVIRDIFTFAVERTAAGGAIEGSFHATGLIPAIVEDLAARGVTIDPAIFKRHTAPRP